MNSWNYQPIGEIRSPFQDVKGVPIQPTGARNVEGRVIVYDAFAEGLKDIEGFSHLILLYHFHKSRPWKPLVTPFLDKTEHGVFATRAPARPNPIGLSIVELLDRDGPILRVRGVDVVDGTPLLDIKPYVPEFDARENVRIGWLEKRVNDVTHLRADDRFAGGEKP